MADERNGPFRLVGNGENQFTQFLLSSDGGAKILGDVYLPFQQVLLSLRNEEGCLFLGIEGDFVFLSFPDFN